MGYPFRKPVLSDDFPTLPDILSQVFAGVNQARVQSLLEAEHVFGWYPHLRSENTTASV